MYWESGEKAIELTQLEWPSSFFKILPVSKSQIIAVLSNDAVANYLPLAE